MSSTFIKPPLDFDVMKELWNKYELADHSILKVRVMLLSVIKRQQEQQSQDSKPTPAPYDLQFQQSFIVLTNERGKPDTKKYKPEELKASIIKSDIRFDTITQDWNEYVVDDGTRIKLQPMIMSVAKTSKFNNKGHPLYWIDINVTVQVKIPPNQSS
jgi:hypothetical protein